MNKTNPFAQSPHYWKLTFTLPAVAIATAENAFEDITLSVANFEADDAGTKWNFDLLFAAPPDLAEVGRRLLLLSAVHDIAIPETCVEELLPQDWLSQVAQQFPPLSIGQFYVHGAHVTEPPPSGSLAIQIEAGAAFGSGEHGTTSRCLEALDWLSRKRRFARVLDMGCGSGILAIASAKLWRAQVVAADIDPIAVRVTGENCKINHARVTATVSDGYRAEPVRKCAPYDLIIANILARPLIAFAPDLARHLAPGGSAILSGLLTSQEKQVLSAHVMQGLKLEKRFVQGEWCTLVLRR